MKSSRLIKRKWYAVFVGACPGIYRTWEGAKRQVENYPLADFKKFKSYAKAMAAFEKRSRCTYEPDVTFVWSYSQPRLR